jgi:4-coumarate--CoA ligase (photoactive yellow protein activation family)
VTSGAPCPTAVGPVLRENGLARLVEIYGSTETGGIGWRDRGDHAFQLFPYWMRENEDRIAKDFGAGRRLYDLPDVATWADERRLVPLKRRDGAVQVGGVNVYPDYLCAAIKAHPAVADAMVRKMRAEEGERLKAFIVPKQEIKAEALRGELEDWLKQRLSPVEMPRAFSFGPRLPTDERGKPCDWPI